MLHAAVVEKRGRALIMPGLPGAGKSTLCAYLVHHGWRHLSDEFGLVRPGSSEIFPFPRLIPLKNDAIDVIAKAVANARIGPRFEGTRKGTVAHVTPPDEHARSSEPARAGLIIVPNWSQNTTIEIQAISPAQCFVDMTSNAFNYQMLGRAGFEVVSALAENVPAYRMNYSNLAAAATALDDLATRHFN